MEKIIKTTALIGLAVLAFSLEPSALPLDVQPLSLETAAATGFNYHAIVTYTDLTNAAAGEKSVQLFPGSGNISTNYQIGPVAWYLTTPFTNSGATMSNLMFNVGFGGTITTALPTNLFGPVLGMDINVKGSNIVTLNGPLVAFSTNLVVNIPMASTNHLDASFSLRGTLPTHSTDLGGQIDIYFRAIDLSKVR